VENRHSGKCGRLVHSLKWVVAVRLLFVEPPSVPYAGRRLLMPDWWSEKLGCTSEKVEDEDEAVRLGEDGMYL
jgi:hypothetical protein